MVNSLIYYTLKISKCFEFLADMNDSIFEARSDNKGFKLRDGIEFHLYINTAPCGDARIFSPREENEEIDRHPHRSSRGQLRTKIESGEGTIPVKTNTVQTWDGVLQVKKLHIYSILIN